MGMLTQLLLIAGVWMDVLLRAKQRGVGHLMAVVRAKARRRLINQGRRKRRVFNNDEASRASTARTGSVLVNS